eukprot:1472041-Pyramimonas_sp.AAC.1
MASAVMCRVGLSLLRMRSWLARLFTAGCSAPPSVASLTYFMNCLLHSTNASVSWVTYYWYVLCACRAKDLCAAPMMVSM